MSNDSCSFEFSLFQRITPVPCCSLCPSHAIDTYLSIICKTCPPKFETRRLDNKSTFTWRCALCALQCGHFYCCAGLNSCGLLPSDLVTYVSLLGGCLRCFPLIASNEVPLSTFHMQLFLFCLSSFFNG